MRRYRCFAPTVLLLQSFFAIIVNAVSIAEIQGPAFQSPLLGQVVRNATGIVTAKVSNITLIVMFRRDLE